MKTVDIEQIRKQIAKTLNKLTAESAPKIYSRIKSRKSRIENEVLSLVLLTGKPIKDCVEQLENEL